MPSTLPVPIEFRLPEGWRPARPEGGEASGVAFAAVHPQADTEFTANITIHGDILSDTVTLADLAVESTERLREATESVVVAERRELGSAEAPALTQRLAFSTVLGGVTLDLIQSQVYLSLMDTEVPYERAVIRLTLTATAPQHDSVLRDFQDFVRTVRPITAAGA
ncbi:hypothetical protein ACH427_15300 [Streptomyces sp. NPDC020379]|uniref:hypothetical protein n=1 Tax=Streptomyces sp. NPDC020379 TaxID=3365071 RepID=UPI00379825D6